MEWSKWIKHLLNFCKWCLTAWIIESVLEYVESTEKTIYDTIFNFVLAFFIFIGLRRYLNKVEDGGAKEKEKNELTDQPNEKEEGTKKAVENVTKVGKAIKTADTRPTSLHERIKETTEELKTGEEKLELRITEKMLEETIQQKDKALRHLTEDNAKLSKSLAELQKNFESKVSEADDFKNRLQVSLKDLHCQKQMFMSQRSLIVKNWSENEKLRCENQKLKCAIEKLKQEANQETVQKRNEVEKKHQEECNKYKEEAEKHQEKVKKLDAELKDYREKFDKECRASREYDNKLRAKESLIMKLERKHIWTVIELDQLKQKHGLKNYSARAPLGELPLEFFDNEAQEKKQKEEDIETLKIETTKKEEEIEKLKLVAKDNEESIQELMAEVEHYKDVIKTVNTLQNFEKLGKIGEEMMKLKEEAKAKKEEVEKTKVQATQNEELIAKLIAEANYDEEMKRLKEEIKANKEEIRKWKETAQKYEKELIKTNDFTVAQEFLMEEEIKAQKQQIATLKLNDQKYQEVLKKLLEKSSEADDLKQELKKTLKNVDELKEEAKKNHKECEELKEEVKKHQEEVEKLKAEPNTQKEEFEKMKVEATPNHDAEMMRLKKQAKADKEEIAKWKEMAQVLENEILEVEKEFGAADNIDEILTQKLKEEIKAQKQQIAIDDQKYQVVLKKLLEKSTEADDLKQELKKSLENVDELKEEMKKNHEECEELKEKVKKHQEEVEKLNVETEAQKEEIKKSGEISKICKTYVGLINKDLRMHRLEKHKLEQESKTQLGLIALLIKENKKIQR